MVSAITERSLTVTFSVVTAPVASKSELGAIGIGLLLSGTSSIAVATTAGSTPICGCAAETASLSSAAVGLPSGKASCCVTSGKVGAVGWTDSADCPPADGCPSAVSFFDLLLKSPVRRRARLPLGHGLGEIFVVRAAACGETGSFAAQSMGAPVSGASAGAISSGDLEGDSSASEVVLSATPSVLGVSSAFSLRLPSVSEAGKAQWDSVLDQVSEKYFDLVLGGDDGLFRLLDSLGLFSWRAVLRSLILGRRDVGSVLRRYHRTGNCFRRGVVTRIGVGLDDWPTVILFVQEGQKR